MIALTFDTDHMTEAMMEVFLDRIMPPDLPATFFLSACFSSLRGARHELAPHPVLGPAEPWPDTVRRAADAVSQFYGSEVGGFRAHSLMSSQLLQVQMNGIGLRYISSLSVPPEQELRPFQSPWGLVEIPIRYMDNMDLWARDRTGLVDRCFDPITIDLALASTTLFCFDFHPIHIMLNSSRFADYEAWSQSGRPQLDAPVERETYGVRDFFLDVCRAVKRAPQQPVTCRDVAGMYWQPPK
jgi:hypothetical protein